MKNPYFILSLCGLYHNVAGQSKDCPKGSNTFFKDYFQGVHSGWVFPKAPSIMSDFFFPFAQALL